MRQAIHELGQALHPVREGRYLLGLSGGADSTALLLMLVPAIREGSIEAEAVHVNHGLRGAESDGDERFCTELCRELHVPLHVCRADLAGKKDEAAAREARFAFFRETYEECRADALMLAHNADDQAETFMMRLLRGAGPGGLECMKADEEIRGIRILRPMLSMRREEIREALRKEGFRWRDDSSNADKQYLRNRVRLELIPALEKISGSAVGKICSAARLIGEDNEALNGEARAVLDEATQGNRLDAEALSGKPHAVRSRVLRMWWDLHGPSLKEHALSAGQTEALDELLKLRRGKCNLPADRHAVRSGRYLFLADTDNPPPAPAEVTGTETAFDGFVLTEGPSQGNPGDGKRTQEVPAGFTRGCVIRTRQPGDRIQPFGSGGSRKLQDYMTDRRIAEPFRNRIPLLCRGQEVLLVCGVGAGCIPDWNGQASPVRLTWHGDMPWME